MEQLHQSSFERLDQIGTQVREGLVAVFAKQSLDWQVTGAGSLFRVHPHQRVVNTYRDAHLDSDEVALMESFQHRLLEREVYFSGYGMGCLNLATSDNDIQHLLNAVDDALGVVAAQ